MNLSLQEIKAIITEAYPHALAENGQFRLKTLKANRLDLHEKIEKYNVGNSNRAAVLINVMRRNGDLPELNQVFKRPKTAEPATQTTTAVKVVKPKINGYGELLPPKERVRWVPEEIKAVAAKWVMLRLENTLEPGMTLFNQAQQSVFSTDPTRIRKIASFASVPEVAKEMGRQWNELKERLVKVPVDRVNVVTIEIPRPLTFDEMLNSMDYASIRALAAAYEDKQQNTTHILLREIAAKAGAINLPQIKPFVPKVDVFESSKKKKKRIVIVGPLKHQFDEIEAKAKETGLDLDLRWLDKEIVHINFGHADYVIVTQHVAHQVWDTSVSAIGKDRTFFVDGGIGAVVQKLRDLNARQ